MSGERDDLHVFRETQPHVIGAFVFLVAISIPINLLAASDMNVAKWGSKNALILAMVPPTVAPLIWRARWVQIAGPLIEVVLIVIYMIQFYPELR